MKRFKKIYVEVTNKCNLNCNFCIKNNRESRFISIDEFSLLLNKVKPYTDYLYFHVMGEPLLHPKINELINIASKSFKINITTNGYLINKIKNNKNIRQINISLHSFNNKNITIKEYLDNIFSAIDILKKNRTYISLRIWIKNKYSNEIISYINRRYDINIKYDIDNYKIEDNVFINNFHEFIWPDLNNELCEDNGKCYGLINQLGILVDGTIIPCCLDSKGIINLGNIYKDSIDSILNSKRVKRIIYNFKNNKKIEDLCKHCKFIDN